jgi:hypothetical protein
MPVLLPCDRCVAVTLTGSATDRAIVAKAKRARGKVHLVSPPFLTFCDYLMLRATFFSKVVYDSNLKVSAKSRAAFIKMSWETHCTPAARQDLNEC